MERVAYGQLSHWSMSIGSTGIEYPPTFFLSLSIMRVAFLIRGVGGVGVPTHRTRGEWRDGLRLTAVPDHRNGRQGENAF